MNNNENLLRQLDNKIWKTKGARFTKYRRCKVKHKTSLFSISLLSVFVLSLNIAGLCFQNTYFLGKDETIIFLTIVISIFILFLSLYENANDYQIKSHQLHESAKEISSLYSKLMLLQAKSNDQKFEDHLAEISQRYDEIILRYQVNHEPLDLDYFKTEHCSTFNISKWKYFYIRTLYFVEIYFLYVIFVFLPLLLVYFLLF